MLSYNVRQKNEQLGLGCGLFLEYEAVHASDLFERFGGIVAMVYSLHYRFSSPTLESNTHA